nr:MAG TPA: hypothetical protein [Caudoviricetes sp.]
MHLICKNIHLIVFFYITQLVRFFNIKKFNMLKV